MFAQIFRDFVKVFSDFHVYCPDFKRFFQIFTKSKLLGVRLHPRPPTPVIAGLYVCAGVLTFLKFDKTTDL